VLLRLRTSGHEAFVVGGTVRDILLRRRPKDYDILTSADPQQVASLFSRALVLGRAFPICHVHQDGAVIEVSSLSTGIDAATVPRDAAAMAAEKKGWGSKEARERRRKKESQKLKSRGTADGGDGSDMDTSGDGAGRSGRAEFSAKNPNKPTWGDARRLNAQKRDFTVNGLLYDPFARLLFDYVGGIADCEARTLRTLGPAMESFTQDPARMLRAVRIAARAGLDIEGDTAAALGALGSKVATLKQGRLQMELAAMMAHGAASKSVQLLWRFGLLELLLPHHAVLLKVG